MGEHHGNPVARANGVPKQQVGGLLIGDGLALIGLQLMPGTDEDGNFVVLCAGVGGRHSEIIPLQPHAFPLGKLLTIPNEEVKKRLRKAMGEPEPEAT